MVDFSQARRAMVDSQLRPNNVTDWRLIAAFEKVPREQFVAEARRALAYIDDAQPIGPGRSLPSPMALAKMLQLAEIGHADTVLDVGIGTGYSTAVIAELASSVVGVEGDATLAEAARANLAAVGAGRASVVQAAPEAGAPQFGPYSVIVLQGAASAVPAALFDQLAEGGRLVAVIASGVTSVTHVYVKAGQDVTARTEFDLNLPPLPLPAPAEQFVF